MNRPNNVLVTGGSGFIAPHLIASLPSDWTATVHVRNASRVPRFAGLASVRVINGGLRQDELVREMQSGISAVFHLAGAVSGPGSGDIVDSNLVTTANVLAAMERAGVPTLVFMSTASVWSDTSGQMLTEDMDANPSTIYGHTKLGAERLINDAVSRGVLERAVALRCNNTYGPGSLQGAVHAFVEQTTLGRPVKVYGDGLQLRQPIYVSDIVDLLHRSLSAPLGMNVYGIGGPDIITVVDMARTIAELLGQEFRVEWFQEHSERVRHIAIDIAKARRELGWNPVVDFRSGIAEVLTARVD